MCGIVGLWDFRKPVDPAELDRFTDAVAHRGPDGRGTYIDEAFANGGLGLGHRRLAILDLSALGANPMCYGGADGKRYWITYNGEVYNFLELRAELAALGHVFRSETDTEVILAAFAQWGLDCLPRFNGMWAFALWDSAERRLFLVRDRFGVKPLYLHSGGVRIAFASEIKAFLVLKDFTPAIDLAVATQAVKTPADYEGGTLDTIMRGVQRIPPGHYVVVDAGGGLKLSRWWDTAAHLPAPPRAYKDQVAAFRDLFFDAVRLRLRSDVAVGTCLSGGIDSSSVAAAMAWVAGEGQGARAAADWRHAFIASFPGTALDETPQADTVAAHVGAVPHHTVFDPVAALAHVADSVWATEEIYNGINVPIWLLYQALRRHGTVVSLDGHGSDELLGGYTWYLDWPTAHVNANLSFEFHSRLLPAILRNYDRCSMAHGIEVRMPLMDWRLVAFAMALPAGSKMGAGYTKRILRDAMAGLLPETILRRRQKIGFNSPLIEWFNGGFAPMIDTVVAHPLWKDSPAWNSAELTPILLGKTRARAWTLADWRQANQMWTRMNVVLWHMIFVEGWRPT